MNRSFSSDKVIILDRDGTIVVDRGYLADPDALEFIPGAAKALRWLFEHGYRLVVITNQSGVGRGLYSIETLERMNARLHAMVEGVGAKLAKIYFCPHTPDANCRCRKPKLALMDQAADELSFDPRASVVVGDKESDVEFGRRAGASAILISPGTLADPRGIGDSLIVPTLWDAALAIVGNRASRESNL